jgi:hypothetical protein
MTNQAPYIFYGIEANAVAVRNFVEHVLQANALAESKGQPKSPICIWGTHGIGKTALVESIAQENGQQFVSIAPAQFEEMGDLIGMPAIEGNRTVFRAPDWTPSQTGPGILLIDDINRADDRILRGLMQLLQDFRLLSWQLPPLWQIVITANPDGGNYAVTPMDDALLTRMMHITMIFEAKVWALWAAKKGVDSRGIDFVLTHPELAHGNRTTPRSLVQFFDSIATIPRLQDQLPLVQMLGSSCLDEATVSAFVGFVQQNLSALMPPSALLLAKDFQQEVHQGIKKIVDQPVFRVDVLATLCTRLVHFLQLLNRPLQSIEVQNLQAFLKMDFMPNDLRLSFLQDLVQIPNLDLKKVMNDPQIGAMLLNGM